MGLTAFAKEGLLRVSVLLENLPEKRFDLDSWYMPRTESECGTTFCAIGHAATNDWFHQHGLRLVKRDRDIRFRTQDGDLVDGFDAVEGFFGIPESHAYYLFHSDDYPTDSPRRGEVIQRIRDYVATNGKQLTEPTAAQREALEPLLAKIRAESQEALPARPGTMPELNTPAADQLRRLLAQGQNVLVPVSATEVLSE